MLTVDIPGWRSLQLEILLLDVNGTLTLDGDLLAGVDAGLKALIQAGVGDVQLVSADTFGRLDNIAAQLGVRAKRLEAGRPEMAQKADVVRQLGASAWSRSATERTTRTCCARQRSVLRS
jgi:soluble P-type ATPase